MLWWLRDDPRLSGQARQLITNGQNELLWSLASSWEIAVKISVGKLDLGRPIQRLFADLTSGQNLELLAIHHEHCIRQANLPLHHRDPFDRMLVAQALTEEVPILTADSKLGLYDIETIF